jgi:beta-glucuronidase
MLYPRETRTRQVKSLNGIWNFHVDSDGVGLRRKWYLRPLADPILMPVPSSYNDITQDPAVRDHIGDVWYERSFIVPDSWRNNRIFVRFGSMTHSGDVWLNGTHVAGHVVGHKGGYLPFEADITSVARLGEENRLTVRVNNILDWTTLPPGVVQTPDDPMHPAGFKTQQTFHDFFNYAGLHRNIFLCSSPKSRIEDITVTTDVSGRDGIIDYRIKTTSARPRVSIILSDHAGRTVAESDSPAGALRVKNARLWSPGKAYLYSLTVATFTVKGDLEDTYTLPVGIRTVKVTKDQFLINGKPFYFKGFGKHEDSDLRGKGFDDVLNIKDFNLLAWLGANSFRTSHYPYSEELMDLADRLGFVVIDEVQAVGMDPKIWHDKAVFKSIMKHHIQVLSELVERDKNRPSVVMWSLANEPWSQDPSCRPYFRKIAQIARKLDPTRPIAVVTCADADKCCATEFFDLVCYNQYFSWYTDPGRLDLIEYQLEKMLKAFRRRFKKPVFMTEYGADTIAGMHQDPPVMFSEEYQCELLRHYHNVFDRLPFVIGEHVWNFADFATAQSKTRVIGNRKGVFTRQRQPKMAARLLRDRWLKRKSK